MYTRALDMVADRSNGFSSTRLAGETLGATTTASAACANARQHLEARALADLRVGAQHTRTCTALQRHPRQTLATWQLQAVCSQCNTIAFPRPNTPCNNPPTQDTPSFLVIMHVKCAPACVQGVQHADEQRTKRQRQQQHPADDRCVREALLFLEEDVAPLAKGGDTAEQV